MKMRRSPGIRHMDLDFTAFDQVIVGAAKDPAKATP